MNLFIYAVGTSQKITTMTYGAKIKIDEACRMVMLKGISGFYPFDFKVFHILKDVQMIFKYMGRTSTKNT